MRLLEIGRPADLISEISRPDSHDAAALEHEDPVGEARSNNQLFGALLENNASEQGASMTAMDNATRNAGELINKLTIQYNRSRQAAITTELIEIIAGIGVFFFPKIFGYVVAAWLLLIIVNLLMIPGYFDVALRDLGLALGALALARLSVVHDR